MLDIFSSEPILVLRQRSAIGRAGTSGGDDDGIDDGVDNDNDDNDVGDNEDRGGNVEAAEFDRGIMFI